MKNVPRFKRYRDLDADSINVEWHVHTNQTDGDTGVEEILQVVHNKQLSSLAFTEHVRRDSDWFAGFAKTIREAARGFSHIEVLVGCEAKVIDTEGRLDVFEEVLEQCDIVLGSVHRFPDNAGGVLDFNDLCLETFAERECELALGLLKAAPIHVLAHPGGMFQRQVGVFPENLFRKIMEASLERGIAIEINTSYLKDMDNFLSLCREINPYVSIGSDTHHVSEIGKCRDTLRKWKGLNA